MKRQFNLITKLERFALQIGFSDLQFVYFKRAILFKFLS